MLMGKKKRKEEEESKYVQDFAVEKLNNSNPTGPICLKTCRLLSVNPGSPPHWPAHDASNSSKRHVIIEDLDFFFPTSQVSPHACTSSNALAIEEGQTAQLAGGEKTFTFPARIHFLL